MPICLGRTLSRSSRPVRFLAVSKCNQVHPGEPILLHRGVASSRPVASAASAASKSHELEQTSKHQALTLLQQVSSFLPHVLSPTGHTVNSLDIWNELLEYAYSVLSERASSSKARIVVYGVDEYSGAHDLVTALLDDTISYDPLNSEVLHTRPIHSSLLIENDRVPKLENNNITISSQWLQQFPIPVQVVEVPSVDTDHLKVLLGADFPVLVVNPVTTPMSSLLRSYQRVLEHPNAILVIAGVRTAQLDRFVQTLSDSLLKLTNNTLTVLYTDPLRALSSLQTFKADTSSLNSIVAYQYGSLISGINDLSKVIRGRLDEIQKTSRSMSSLAVRSYTAFSILQRSLYASRTVLHDAEHEMEKLRQNVSELKFRVEELKAKSSKEILGLFDGPELVEAKIKDEVSIALNKAKRDIKAVMDGLKWWNLFWRVDEITDIVCNAVDKAWCRDLEQNLILHTGLLTALQQDFSSSTTSLLSKYPPSSCFSSSILANTLSQLQATPSYALTHTSLTTPIQTRKSQLAASSTTRLHVRAQQAVLGMSSSVLGGLGISWTGWMELSEPFVGLGAETTVGVGMLSAAFGLRWAIGAWEKAKKRWWQDWERVGQGLTRDLKTNLDKVISENVVIVPATACERLETLAIERKEQIADLREQITLLEHKSKCLYELF